MSEIENPKETMEEVKETVKEPPKELAKETPKEPKIQKFYNFCGSAQNALIIIEGVFLSLYYVLVSFINIFSNVQIHGLVKNTVFDFLLTIFLMSVIFIIIGISLYILYLLNRVYKIKKTYSGKFIIRGIIGLILVFIMFFIAAFSAAFDYGAKFVIGG